MLVQFALLLLAAAPSDSVPAGTQLIYRGRFVAEKGDTAAGEKLFDLTIVTAKSDSGTIAYWTTEERGHGGWTWLDRFGKLTLNDRLRHVEGIGPTLLSERPEGSSVVPLLLPFVTYAEPFAIDTAWMEGGLDHRVVASEKIGETDCWRIDVRSPIGRKRSMWVDRDSPAVMAVSETVFIGQGEQHNLRYELVARDKLDEGDTTKIVAAFDELLRLRSRLEFTPQVRDYQWTAQRLALLKADLPMVMEKAKETSLTKLVQAAAEESKTQKDRSNALGAIQGKIVGRASPRPELETIAGAPFAWDEIQGKVTILHFWEYRDTPLEEPYGQVAYLDYLSRKHQSSDVRVLGVVADERVTQADARRAGVQSAKRLHAFMNLSYPLLVDAGKAIKLFGDPRATGAKLPLFVVLDRAGKIIHYHVGHYEVNRDRGLEELDTVVTKALDNRG